MEIIPTPYAATDDWGNLTRQWVLIQDVGPVPEVCTCTVSAQRGQAVRRPADENGYCNGWCSGSESLSVVNPLVAAHQGAKARRIQTAFIDAADNAVRHKPVAQGAEDATNPVTVEE